MQWQLGAVPCPFWTRKSAEKNPTCGGSILQQNKTNLSSLLVSFSFFSFSFLGPAGTPHKPARFLPPQPWIP